MKALLSRSSAQRKVSLTFGLFSAGSFLVFLFFLISNSEWLDVIGRSYILTGMVPVSISMLAFLLSYRRPENPVSWLLVLIAVLVQTLYLEPAISIVLEKGQPPTLGLVILHNLWTLLSGLFSTFLAYVFVIFPTGRLPSRRWRVANWLLGLQVLVTLGRGLYLTVDLARSFALAGQGLLEITLTPLTRTGSLSSALHTREIPALAQVSVFVGVLALGMVLLGFSALFSRFQSGGALERLQIKWILYALAFWAVSIFLVISPLNVSVIIFALVLPLLLTAMAIAILRYRLYDIDVIIHRTLVYSSLTALLAALYFTSVVIMQPLFQRMIGHDSPLAVVISTLLMALAFNPLRRRIQGLIDLRFYRRKYDAGETLEHFAAIARTEVDIDSLSEALLGAASKSMQPQRASLWLRKG